MTGGCSVLVARSLSDSGGRVKNSLMQNLWDFLVGFNSALLPVTIEDVSTDFSLCENFSLMEKGIMIWFSANGFSNFFVQLIGW